MNNLLRNQFNLTPSNILYTGFLTSFWIAPRNGLGALDPMETTTDHRTRQWFFNLKDQVYFRRGALFEIGYAANRTFGREIPQGHSLLINAADGRHGDSFIDATRKGGRDQFLANLFLPSFTALGGHQVKIGIDLDAVNYWQDVTRTGCLFLRADNSASRLVIFGGSGRLRLSNSEASWYAQDSWKVRPRLQLQIGLRQDWDRLAGNADLSPRIGFSWAPPHLESTKISGGYGIVYEATSLEVFSQPTGPVFAHHPLSRGRDAGVWPRSLRVYDRPGSIQDAAVRHLEPGSRAAARGRHIPAFAVPRKAGPGRLLLPQHDRP